MDMAPDYQPLIDHLCHNSELSPSQARKLVTEVIAYLAESPEDYVRRRHRELKQEQGLANPEIFGRIEAEVVQRVFATAALTQRQIRRIIYG